MSDKELSVLEKAQREVELLEWSMSSVKIAGQAHQRMYHTAHIPANYQTAIDALDTQLVGARTLLKQIESLVR
jgi:hypothetical protein